MKTICLYHRIDLDGWMSAAIVKHWFKTSLTKGESYIINGTRTDRGGDLYHPEIIDFKGYTYGDKAPDVTSYDRIIMCDMSLLKGVMEQLHEDHSKEIIWIDHHKSAIEDSERPLKYNDLKGIRDTKFAACELTWKYFFPIETIPEIIRLLGRYDCFGHKGTSEEIKVLEFQYGARQAIPNYNTAYDYLMYNLQDDIDCVHGDEHVVNRLHIEGRSIYEYLCTEAKQIYANRFDLNLNGFKFIAINRERFNPINFNIDYNKDGYDGVACFYFDGTTWVFSLYNDNGLVDCSAIAKQFGGGGHAGASGFRLPIGDKIDSFLNPRKS